ncbi:hypothetical protein THASP1DRAFT_28903 [Thamnocephalis sphaerospora]|uniref:Uncharacterized protein n=1 Tax=Thamnocephalis sphaerospora TaxID=78915 RepID=A0A4V1IWZ7_9FUNG|nr:hypothetical protein THASP1DRAFT_28903 [Thamnocephalis sphaerospora]|eukprot:RKP09299.1 hypothetical protein THASP1DRAFT_28903 [Thamnocephalis sphaerospora]
MSTSPRGVWFLDEKFTSTPNFDFKQLKTWRVFDSDRSFRVATVIGLEGADQATVLDRVLTVELASKQQISQRSGKGVWLSETRINDVLVMDVGPFGCGDLAANPMLVENSVALAIALSEVIIINYSDPIGNGQTATLCTAIAALNVTSLLDSGKKRRLIFFVSDHGDTAGATDMRKEITTQLEKCWKKPNQKPGGPSLSDVYDISVLPFPCGHGHPERLDECIEQLHAWFTKKDDSEYVFKDKYCGPVPPMKLVGSNSDPYIWEKIFDMCTSAQSTNTAPNHVGTVLSGNGVLYDNRVDQTMYQPTH